ncbi:MAG: inositol-3-phosphate synthase [Actinomycetes bacterium]
MSARIGLWLVGVRGSVGTTTTAGLAATASGLAAVTGLVTELPDLQVGQLPALPDIVVGGHDICSTPLPKRAEQLVEARVLPAGVPAAVAGELAAADARVRAGYTAEDGDQRGQVHRLAADIREFASREQVDRVVVLNVSSTEAPVAAHPAHDSLEALERAWDAGESALPPSSAYAAAAFLAGAAFVDFTPSTGAGLPALRELAVREGLPWGGSDGKTGETLLKSVLAPMFAMRALRVRSWAGTNLLGGGDGATLADPAACESKAVSKARGLEAMLGEPVDGPVHIDYLADLGDWKTAWDHVSFEGFLGTRMTLQFTWQGCDSALAAPLVIDLCRLMALALARGEVGPVPALGFFFKDPVDSDEHRLAEQWTELLAWARR